MKFKIIDHVDVKTVKDMHRSTPIFVLTTGRSGSKFIANFFNELHADVVDAHHEPSPVLESFPDSFYNNQNNYDYLESSFKLSRIELILKSYIKDKVYFESNQCLVFLAHAIIKTFPNARFIHLVRNPVDFTLSAIRKGWYVNDSIWESGRIKLRNLEKWNAMTQLEKIAWYWQENNSYIEKFKKTINPSQVLTLKFEDMVSDKDSLIELLNFCGVWKDINIESLIRLQNVKINELVIKADDPKNIRKLAYYPKYEYWKREDRASFLKHVKKLSAIYQYSLTKGENQKDKELKEQQQVINLKDKELKEQQQVINLKDKGLKEQQRITKRLSVEVQESLISLNNKNKDILLLNQEMKKERSEAKKSLSLLIEQKKIISKVSMELNDIYTSKKYKLALKVSKPYVASKKILRKG